jgi:hypothetical protein
MRTTWGTALGRIAGVALGLCLAFGGVTAAQAAKHAYLTGVNEPWDDYSNQDAMTGAFGSDWDRLQYGDSFSDYALLYIDGGSLTSFEMIDYLNSNRGLLENYVLGGGRLFINAGTDLQTDISLVFGASSGELIDWDAGFSASAVDPTSSLFDGAGTSWDGFYFSQNSLDTPDTFKSLINDDKGNTVLSGGFFGDGYVMLGTQTNTTWHAGINGSDPFQLRVNELLYALNVQPPPVQPTIPEPETYALMVLGLAGVAIAVRRQRRPAAAA